MRIIAFDVRPDERAEFERQAQRPDEARNALNAYLAAGGSRL